MPIRLQLLFSQNMNAQFAMNQCVTPHLTLAAILYAEPALLAIEEYAQRAEQNNTYKKRTNQFFGS